MRTLIKQAYYQMLDMLHCGKGVPTTVEGVKLRFPARCSRYYDGRYEPETFRFLREYCRPAGVTVDVGAHIGLFSVAMAQLVGPLGKVFSFEPTFTTRQILTKTIQLNQFDDRVLVRPEALSSHVGTAKFYDTGDYLSNANSLVATLRVKGEVLVPTTTLDTFISEEGLNPCCIKVDAEGAEFEVLLGAMKTIRSAIPMNLALHPCSMAAAGHSLDEVWDLITETGAQLYFSGSLVSREWFCGHTELFDVWVLGRCHPTVEASGT